ncbi:DUF4240 domain-containing protein [Lentzea sp. BCCO 10_0061]|uniref:DUF4240 domain-containing protein n=1 Tax=Lentzea sokolovensis TaxID=3095429 RepID=A0ABU4VC11_9PSEU|nr:DUF4240 domain-containing protein [Lentzea sp. BCCO 10_0061]MDX8148486.1 DUF4240 domain-containing protein [Lentzea sp. BCCO 10_0061]
MDAGGFWKLVDHAVAATADLEQRREWLSGRLALLPAGEIADFAVRLDEQRVRVDTWAHWQAATLICSGLCSGDGFFYFQAWLIGQGRSVFESVAASPDALADLPAVARLAALGPVDGWSDEDWPEWEVLYRVPDAAFEAVYAGDLDDLLASRGQARAFDVSPGGEDVEMEDPVDIARRIPRLWALFGKVAR